MSLLRTLPSFVVHAQTWTGLQDTDVATFQSIETIFANIIGAVMSLAGVALFLMLLAGGFSFLFSGGDPKKLEQAKGTLGNAIMGLVVIVAAYLIIRIVSAFTGVANLTIFSVPVL